MINISDKYNYYFGSGSGRIRIADPDPADPGRYYVQANEIFNIVSKILKIIAHLTLMRKIKHCELTLLCKQIF